MVWVSLDSASLNFSNRRMRTRLSGGVAGEERKLSPLCRLDLPQFHSRQTLYNPFHDLCFA